jgi:hypothetical protein
MQGLGVLRSQKVHSRNVVGWRALPGRNICGAFHSAPAFAEKA